VVGVTMADIFVPDFTFLFGLSYLSRRSALVSVARLGAERITSTHIAPHSRLVRRASKIAIHELGHGFGLDHCREPGCVMRYSDSVAALDRESSRFGPRCRERLDRLQLPPG
jgi:archaemetzincin